jgi:hypothetical protein
MYHRDKTMHRQDARVWYRNPPDEDEGEEGAEVADEHQQPKVVEVRRRHAQPPVTLKAEPTP